MVQRGLATVQLLVPLSFLRHIGISTANWLPILQFKTRDHLSVYCCFGIISITSFKCLLRKPGELQKVSQLFFVLNELLVQQHLQLLQEIVEKSLNIRLLHEQLGPGELIQIIMIRRFRFWPDLYLKQRAQLLNHKGNSTLVHLLPQPLVFFVMEFIDCVDSQVQELHLIRSVEDIVEVIVLQSPPGLVVVLSLHLRLLLGWSVLAAPGHGYFLVLRVLYLELHLACNMTCVITRRT